MQIVQALYVNQALPKSEGKPNKTLETSVATDKKEATNPVLEKKATKVDVTKEANPAEQGNATIAYETVKELSTEQQAAIGHATTEGTQTFLEVLLQLTQSETIVQETVDPALQEFLDSQETVDETKVDGTWISQMVVPRVVLVEQETVAPKVNEVDIPIQWESSIVEQPVELYQPVASQEAESSDEFIQPVQQPLSQFAELRAEIIQSKQSVSELIPVDVEVVEAMVAEVATKTYQTKDMVVDKQEELAMLLEEVPSKTKTESKEPLPYHPYQVQFGATETKEVVIYDKVDVLHQVQENLVANVSQGKEAFVLKLNPAGLGEITVTLTQNAGKMSLQLVASSEEVKGLLHREIGQLKDALRSYQVDVNDVLGPQNDLLQQHSFQQQSQSQPSKLVMIQYQTMQNELIEPQENAVVLKLANSRINTYV